MIIKDPFVKVTLYALAGVVLGLLAGFIFGAVIMYVGLGLFSWSEASGLYEAAPFFAMGWGSVLGAIFGGVVALKK